MMKDWKATIRLADGSQAKVMIQFQALCGA